MVAGGGSTRTVQKPHGGVLECRWGSGIGDLEYKGFRDDLMEVVLLFAFFHFGQLH